MDEKSYYLLLDVINRNGSIQRITREGITYAKIAEMTNKAITDNLISNVSGRLTLTEKGKVQLLNLESGYKKKNKNLWIEPENSSKISPIDKNDIYLPNQNDLWFN
jgi:hypothetical protein